MLIEESKPNNPRRSTSLTATLAFAFAALSIFSMLLVGIFQTVRNFQAQQAVAIGQQRLIAQDAAGQVAAFVEQIFNTLEVAAQANRSFSEPLEEQQSILDNLLILQPALRTVTLLDRQGRELVKQSRFEVVTQAELTNLAESDLFEEVSQGNRFVSSVYLAESTVEPLVTMAVPIKDPFGDFAGVVVAEVNLKFMWDLVASLQVGEAGTAYVVDEQGDLIAFEDVSRILRGENLRDLTEVAEFLAGQATDEQGGSDVSAGIDGNQVLATYVPLGKPNWAVVAEVPLSEAYQGVYGELVVSLLVMLLGAVLAAVAGVYVSRRLAAPLLHLTETAVQIAQGNLNLEAPVEGASEIGRLASAFNSMTRQLRGLIDRLELQIRRLGIAAVLSERLSAILNLETLLAEVVEQVQDSFHYYHTSVYLLDQQREYLVIAEGAGGVGRQLKDQRYAIPLNDEVSLVARAARNQELVQVDDVHNIAGWLPHALLPDTRAEIAIPIVLDEAVVGVLDIQSDKVGELEESDASLLRSLVNQVAVTMRNANLFTEVEESLALARLAQIRYTQQAWQAAATSRVEYNYHRDNADSLDALLLAQLKRAASQQVQPVVIPGIDSRQEQAAIVAPIRFQNQVIGTMHFLETDPDRAHVWTEQEMAFIQAIADQVAQSAENLRLFDETRERAGREQTIREITDKLRAAPSLNMLMETAARELGAHLGVRRAVLELGIDAAGEPQYEEGNGHAGTD